jgi:hypothetical protein
MDRPPTPAEPIPAEVATPSGERQMVKLRLDGRREAIAGSGAEDKARTGPGLETKTLPLRMPSK